MTSVTVPTDYATIQAACNALAPVSSDASKGTVYILNGEYEEAGNYGLGLYIRNYVNLVGESKEGVLIYPPAGVAGGDGIFYPGYNAQHENLTIYARAANHYALHQDHWSPWVTWKNCIFHHEDPGKAAIGAGARAGQRVTLLNCTVSQGTASVHGDIYSRAVSVFPWLWDLKGCTLPQFQYHDCLEYKENRIRFQGCTIGTLLKYRSEMYYNANPDDPLFNRGYKPLSAPLIDAGGNTVTTGGELLQPYRGKKLVPLLLAMGRMGK